MEPAIVRQQRRHLRRNKAHLRLQLGGLLAGVLDRGAQGRIDRDDDLGTHRAILRQPKRDEVRPGRNLPQSTAIGGRGIAEPRAVDVQKHFVGMGPIGNRLNGGWRVGRAAFG